MPFYWANRAKLMVYVGCLLAKQTATSFRTFSPTRSCR